MTYAQQDKKGEDEVAGPGKGFVNVFDTSGNLIRRLVSNGNLNAPWGLALVDGELWVGNFGDGKINNYDPATGAFLETISDADGNPLVFDGLWDLLPAPPPKESFSRRESPTRSMDSSVLSPKTKSGVQIGSAGTEFGHRSVDSTGGFRRCSRKPELLTIRMVEARGVEPLSSKLSTQASTCLAGD